eukprot:SAG31_NODE_21746_length_541_cov_1.857466_1_plen_63_part_01
MCVTTVYIPTKSKIINFTYWSQFSMLLLIGEFLKIASWDKSGFRTAAYIHSSQILTWPWAVF